MLLKRDEEGKGESDYTSKQEGHGGSLFHLVNYRFHFNIGVDSSKYIK